MPPFLSAECTNSKCRHKNRFDLAELRKTNGYTYKGTTYRAVKTDEEMIVTCEKCGQRFKIMVPPSDDKVVGRRDAEAD